MSNNFVLSLGLLTSGICASGAIYLAFHGKEGWGWLIFAAILTSKDITFSKDKK